MDILVIEDDSSIRRLVEETLRDEGLEVDALPDATAALEQLRSGAQPRLIVLDKRMPGVDGYEFVRAYRDEVEHPAIVILLTASAEPTDLPQGVSAYLQKPFDLDDLVSLVRRYIGGQAGQETSP